MNGLNITKSIGVPYLTLENFELAESDSRYILTSPRSLEACERCGIKPLELLRRPVEEFYEEYKDRDFLSRSEVLEEFHLQEKVRQSKLSQAREERNRLIYLEDDDSFPETLKKSNSYLEANPPLKRPNSRDNRRSPREAWLSSTSGSNLEMRSPLQYDGISNNPQRVHDSWAASLRSSSSDISPSTSTPLKSAVSCEDLSLSGRKPPMSPRPRPRSASLPRKHRAVVDGRLSASDRADRSSVEDLKRSYDRLLQSHQDLTANITLLEKQLKEVQIAQKRDELIARKARNIEALRLKKASNTAATKAKISRGNYLRAKKIDAKAKEHAVKKLKIMESNNRSHMLRETQAHINELKAEIRHYKTHQAARLIQAERNSWLESVATRRSRALERADVKVRRQIRDRSAKARRARMEKERKHAQNMKTVMMKEELALLRNLDAIISKDQKCEDIAMEKASLLRKHKRSATRRPSPSRTRSKSFDEMNKQAALMARLEMKGIRSYVKHKETTALKSSNVKTVASPAAITAPPALPPPAIKPALKAPNKPPASEPKKVTIAD